MSLAAEADAGTTRAVPASRARRDHPIAYHLALFAIGILTPVLLIVTLMLIDAAHLRRDDALRDANTVVRHLNATIEVEIEKAIAVAQTLATSRAISEGDHATFDGQARDVANRLGLVIVLRDLSGQQLTSTAVPPGTPLPVSNENVRAVDRLAAERKAPVVSDLLIGTVMRIPLVIADIPVFDGPKVIAFIDVVLRPQRIGEILAQDLPEDWIAGVLGRDGRLIARSVDEDRFIGTINQPFLDAATKPEGTWTGIAREGTPIAGAYIRSPLSGWLVSVAVPESTLHAPVKWAMAWLGGLAVAALGFSVWLGWRLSRSISAPIRDLVGRARELGEGRRLAASESGVAEINAVTDALSAASVELDRRAAAAEQAADAVRANEERLQLVQDSAEIGTFDWDIETERTVCSLRFYQMFSLLEGTRVAIADVTARIHPDDRGRIERARAVLFGRGGPFEDEFRVLSPDGTERWIHVKGHLDLKDARPLRLLAASIDITERKRSEEHLRFLLREISHRSKNLLAVILAMASQTAKSAETVDVFRRRFGERLMGISASHDLLVNQNWMGAPVENLVRGQLSPFIEAIDRRVLIHGPDVDLKAEMAEALGIALHELATNSLKYGALKDQDGKVEITWTVYGPDNDDCTIDGPLPRDGQRFRMEWIEHTVFPVTPPSHKGFGRMVIEHTVQATLSGTVTLEFPSGGLRWRIDAPATCLAPAARGIAA